MEDMSSPDRDQVNVNDIQLSNQSRTEHHEINCPVIGNVNVFIQGNRATCGVVILTVHDLGCNHNMYNEFVTHPRMQGIRDRVVWVHVDLPGQELDAAELPPSYTFPTMQKIGENLVTVLDQLKIKEVVCFGEGAGANILARFAIAQQERVLGTCLIHCTGTTAGFMESVKDKVINWKLDHIGMNPSAENYLVLHRFGQFAAVDDREQLKQAIETYQDILRTKTNPKNLKKFVDAFLKRTNIADQIKKLQCQVLFMTGSKSVFNSTTRSLHQHLLKYCSDKGKVEFIEVQGVANILEEKPEKLMESFQYFLQGLGLVSAVPMHNVRRGVARMRSMSMEEYDMPKMRQRSFSNDSPGTGSPLSSSPTQNPTANGPDSAVTK